MHLLVEVNMNSLYGEQIRKVMEERFLCESEFWMMTEYDEKVCEKVCEIKFLKEKSKDTL